MFYFDPNNRFVVSHSTITNCSNVFVYSNGIELNLDDRWYFIDKSGSMKLIVKAIERIKYKSLGKIRNLVHNLSSVFINSLYNNSRITCNNILSSKKLQPKKIIQRKDDTIININAKPFTPKSKIKQVDEIYVPSFKVKTQKECDSKLYKRKLFIRCYLHFDFSIFNVHYDTYFL